VVDPASRKVKIVKNVDDGTNYWHTAVAYDTTSNQFIVGKRAKNQVRDLGRSVSLLLSPICLCPPRCIFAD
jgi:hypothetical protein